MEIAVWRNLPDEIALNVIAKLLPRRSLVGLRPLWKEWNEMLSSYAAMQRIYPNIHHSQTCTFLFQFGSFLDDYINAIWVMEGSEIFYKVGEYSYHIHNARNTMFCLSDNEDEDYYICDEKNRSLRHLDYAVPCFIANGFDYSRNQFIYLVGDEERDAVRVYMMTDTLEDDGQDMEDDGQDTDSTEDDDRDRWRYIIVSMEGCGEFWVGDRGVYNKGRFYWLDQLSCNGEVMELNLEDGCWTKIQPPDGSIYRHSNITVASFYDDGVHDQNVDNTSIASMYWYLAGSEMGPLILVDKEYKFMWELQSEEGNENIKTWHRVDIRLPDEITLISVNNLGWTVVVGEGIHVYDGSRRLVRKTAFDDVDPELGKGLKLLKSPGFPAYTWEKPALLPFECTYLWWPGPLNFQPYSSSSSHDSTNSSLSAPTYGGPDH